GVNSLLDIVNRSCHGRREAECPARRIFWAQAAESGDDPPRLRVKGTVRRHSPLGMGSFDQIRDVGATGRSPVHQPRGINGRPAGRPYNPDIGATSPLGMGCFGCFPVVAYSTVTLLARLRGWSTSVPLATAAW